MRGGRRFEPEEIAEVVRLHRDKWSARRIACYIKRPLGSISSLKHRLGLTSKHKPPTAEDLLERAAASRARARENWPRHKEQRNEAIRKPAAGQAACAAWQSRFLNPEDRRAGR
jgi:hypothetical protein